ncbi:hypothetical protein P5V15_004904 [Pogonomyrmex californicus]
MQKAKKKGKMQQPSSSFADCAEATLTDEDVGKDFGILINAPLSKGGHFVLKSEKTWAIDSSQYSEFFTLNLKMLSAAIDCVPFNEYVDVDDRYFVSDQLTSIYNNAERGKAAYNAILNELDTSSLSNAENETENMQNQSENLTANVKFESNDNVQDLEEDLDFLLSLKEPVQDTRIGIAQSMSLPVSHNSDSKTKSKNIPNKPIDLEKWLDSVLDD